MHSTLFRALPVARVRFELEALDRIALPSFAGSTFRGLLGHALKDAACARHATRGVCETCPHDSSCDYAYLFETRALIEEGFARGSEEVPRPFVLVPPRGQAAIELGESFSLHLTLLGNATTYLPYFFTALEAMGRRGVGQLGARFALMRAWSADSDGALHPLYEGGQPTGRMVNLPQASNLSSLAERVPLEAGVVELDFYTPTRINHRGEGVQRPEFHTVIRALLRRLDNLLRVHGTGPLQLDFRELVADAEEVPLLECSTRWVDWERTSSRQQQRIKQGGFVGQAVYGPEALPFMPLLKVGSIIHLGKATTFGMGGYRCAVLTVGDGDDSDTYPVHEGGTRDR